MKKIIALTLTLIQITSYGNPQQWSGTYYTNNSHYQYEWATKYLKNITLTKHASILDVGCGSGDITAHIAQLAPQSTVVGIDFSQDMITAAHIQHASLSNLTFHTADAQNFSLNKQFNVIFSSSAFHWMEKQQDALHCMARHLAPQGELHILMSGKPNGLVQVFKKNSTKTTLEAPFS